jgi:hypothetical protein
VIPAGGGVAAIAVGSFWLGRRTKSQIISASEALVYNTSNDSTSANGKAELPHLTLGNIVNYPSRAENNHRHSDNNHHHYRSFLVAPPSH